METVNQSIADDAQSMTVVVTEEQRRFLCRILFKACHAYAQEIIERQETAYMTDKEQEAMFDLMYLYVKSEEVYGIFAERKINIKDLMNKYNIDFNIVTKHHTNVEDEYEAHRASKMYHLYGRPQSNTD